MEKPPIVSAAEWQVERDALLVAEKQATRTLDALAARRRRLPMVAIDKTYTFATPDGPKTLLELFDGRRQLVVYQFMDRGPDTYCPGCTNFTDNVPITALARLAKADVTWMTVSNMPLAQITAYKAQRGWTLPFVSSHGTTFSADIGAGEGFLLTGDDAHRGFNHGSEPAVLLVIDDA